MVRRLVYVHDTQVVKPAAQHPVRCQSHPADVQEGQQAGAVGREDVVSHRLVVEETGAAGIDPGGCPGGEADFVGVDRGWVTTVIEVPVQVD